MSLDRTIPEGLRFHMEGKFHTKTCLNVVKFNHEPPQVHLAGNLRFYYQLRDVYLRALQAGFFASSTPVSSPNGEWSASKLF